MASGASIKAGKPGEALRREARNARLDVWCRSERHGLRHGGIDPGKPTGPVTSRRRAESAPVCQTNSQTAAADPDPGGWNSWWAANFAAAREQQTALSEFERDIMANVIAHLQRECDDKIKLMREELDAQFSVRCAELGTELALRTAELGVEVAGLKAELCRRLDRALGEMRKVLAAGDARGAETGPKTLN